MSNLSDSKLGKTIQKSKVSFSIYIQYDIQLGWEYLTTQLDPRLTMELQHLQTIQTSHCQRMSKTWRHHDMPQHSAILWSPPHTRPWRPRRQSGCWTKKCTGGTRLSSVPRQRPGGRNISRSASCSRALRTKPDFWNAQKCTKKGHSTETCRISLIQNLEKQSRNPRFHSASTYSMKYSWVGSIWQLNSIRDERWNYSTCEPSKLLTVRGCRSKIWHHDMPQHSAILRSPPHTRPWHPRRQSGCLPNWCSWRTRLSSVPRPRPGGSDRLRLASC